MKMCALREQCHEQERCTVGGCSRQSNRDAARARSWHSGLACVLAAAGRYSRKPSNPRLLDDAELDQTCTARWISALAELTAPTGRPTVPEPRIVGDIFGTVRAMSTSMVSVSILYFFPH